MKVLLVGIDFFSYTESLKRALERLGHTVETCEVKQGWGTVGKIHREVFNIIQKKIFHRNTLYRLPLFFQEARSKSVIRVAEIFKPDLLIAFPGYGLTKKALQQINGCKKAVWIYDAIDRLPDMAKVLSAYDKVFTFEGSDLGKYKQIGVDATFLPLCVDDEIYYPSTVKKDIDISFVGNLSEARLKTLMDIRDAFPDVKMVVYGRYLGSLERSPGLGERLLAHRDIFTKKLISSEDANSLYARSKICINIHHGQSKYGANMRLFEICATKGFQIVDSNKYINDNFVDCMSLYNSEEDLIKKIRYYLAHDEERERISEIGYKKMITSELFIHRAKTIIEETMGK